MRFARDPRSRLMVPDRRLRMSAPHQALLMHGGAASFASTWNSGDKDADITLSGSDLIASLTQAGGVVFGAVRAFATRDASLNRYFEITAGGADIQSILGIGTSASSLANYPGAVSTSYGFYVGQNQILNNAGATISPYFPLNDNVVGVLVDFTAGTITLRRGGKFYDVSYSGISGTLYPFWGPSSGVGSRTATLNTGGSAFTMSLPPGATAWGGTWNSADKDADVTLSGSDLVASVSGALGSVRGTQGRSSGKYYFEITRTGDGNQLAGVGKSTATLANYPGSDANGWSYHWGTNTRFNNASNSAIPVKTSVAVGVWLNAGVLKFIVDDETGTTAATGLTGNQYPMWGSGTGTAGTRSGTVNLTGGFFNTLPSGASAWN